MWRFFAGLVLSLGACAPVDYDSVSRGEFEGLVQLFWVGGALGSPQGDGKFLYVPHATAPLRFTSKSLKDPDGDALVIEPAAFFTDGGSVPRMVQGVPGFNAWAFGSAYVIHDWVFEAHRCLNYAKKRQGRLPESDTPTEEMKALSNMTFAQSAQLMAEGIKTLLDGEVSGGPGGVIASFTAGPISHALWREEKSCEEIRAPKDPAPQEIEARMRQKSLSQAQRDSFVLRDGRRVKLLGLYKVP
ncbi:hypothetical protein [Shimia haliotis]|uniref:DUF1353 domain-containing protein n=1 Tax=Shimia haliotis TaxID=1280847 RepID=A0A1I4AJN2_9RHOB|nr:hypothetical protein [Shimia haliotis]SFK56473.1 hypothetical protein SAMN04488036_101417 [Shimia haliotis]